VQQAKRGRPAEHDVCREDFVLSCEAGSFVTELCAEYGISENQVRRLKKSYGLQGVAEAARLNLPCLEQLTEWWEETPTLTARAVAEHVGVHRRTLLAHFRRIGFQPNPTASDSDVMDALLTMTI
jgi:transposase-like protein